MKTKFITLLSLAALSATLFAVPVTTYADYVRTSNRTNHEMSYNQAKRRFKKHVFKLAFFENTANDDMDTVYYQIGYYNKGKMEQRCINSNEYTWREIVDPNLSTPFVIFVNDHQLVIHRPPYSQYNQPMASGTVTAKEGDGDQSW